MRGTDVKNLAMRVFLDSGLIRLLESWRPRPGLLALNYHRVMESEQCIYDRNVISATPDQFFEQVKFLKRRFRIVSLDEVLDAAGSPSMFRDFRILLTFDDGYIDNFKYVYPILKSHGVPGTFFIPTSFIGDTAIPWWDRVAYLIRNTEKRQLQIPLPSKRDLHIDLDLGDRDEIISRLLTFFERPEITDSDALIEELANACGLDPPTSSHGNEFMNWVQINEMASHGMAIGSHSHTHGILAKMSAERQYQELSTSRDILQRRLGIPIRSLAYPVGTPTTYDSVTVRQAKRAGYEIAFSYHGGINGPRTFDRFDIQRTSVENDMTLDRIRVETAFAASFGRAFF